jgi:1-carboxybiuret hydrolase subunit AtzG-like protein
MWPDIEVPGAIQHSGTRMEPDTALDSYIEAAAKALALPIEPAWTPAIAANLAVNLRLAAQVGVLELPDEAEPAPVYGA